MPLTMTLPRRSRPTGPMRLLALVSAVVASVALLPSNVAAAKEGSKQAFRCESEEDLDGSSCRVDMLPDSALAEMVYERGFDVEGADRLQLLDAVMQLLDYEYATGENLREMEYIPDDGSAAAAAETAAADLELAAANAAAAALAAEAEAEVAALAAAAGTAGAGEGDDLHSNLHTGFEAGVTSEEEETVALGADDDAAGDEIAREVIEESTSSSSSPPPPATSCAAGVGGGAQVGHAFSESTLLGYAQGLASEVLHTMQRDLNSLVGMLPAPVAKPIRDTAAFVGHTATKFVAPALQQAERFTRGLRRGAGKAAGKAALALKDDVLPRVLRGATAAVAKAKRRLGKAIAARRARGEEGGEQEQEQQ